MTTIRTYLFPFSSTGWMKKYLAGRTTFEYNPGPKTKVFEELNKQVANSKVEKVMKNEICTAELMKTMAINLKI